MKHKEVHDLVVKQELTKYTRNFSQNIRKYLDDKNIGIIDLATALGKSRSSVSDRVSNTRNTGNVSLKIIIEYSLVTGIPVSELLQDPAVKDSKNKELKK